MPCWLRPSRAFIARRQDGRWLTWHMPGRFIVPFVNDYDGRLKGTQEGDVRGLSSRGKVVSISECASRGRQHRAGPDRARIL